MLKKFTVRLNFFILTIFICFQSHSSVLSDVDIVKSEQSCFSKPFQSWDCSLSNEYYASFDSMVADCNLEEPLLVARTFITHQGMSLLDKEIDVIKANLKDFLHKTNGTSMFLELIWKLSALFNDRDLKIEVLSFCRNNGIKQQSLLVESRNKEEGYSIAVNDLFST